MAELESANRLQKALVSTTRMLAHDMRKPFTLARSGLALLKNKKDTEYRDRIIAMMDSDMTKSLTLVEGMLDDLMTFGVEVKLKTREISLYQLIENALQHISRSFPESNRQIKVNYNHCNEVVIDEVRIQRVLLNLLSNALEANKRQDSVLVETFDLPTSTLIKIRNSGSYIPEEKLERIFEPFFTEGKKKGTGLGLPIAKKFLEAHKSQLSCHSDAEQKFVEFSFNLPKAPKKDMKSAKPIEAKLSESKEVERKTGQNKLKFLQRLKEKVKRKGSPLQVAVLDDEETARKSIQFLCGKTQVKDFLKDHYYSNSITLLNGSYEKMDCLILDIDLQEKDEDGISLTKKIRTGGYEGVICLHTNSMDPKTQVEGLQAGADLVMTKPMSEEHFIRILGIEH